VKTLSRLGAGLAMAAAAAVVDLLGGIADCCCIPHSSTVQFRGKPLILVIGRWRHPSVVFLLWGFVFGARHQQAGPADGEVFESRLLWR
jgi:hypothetical protein